MAATRQVVLYSIRSGRGFAQAAAIVGKQFAATLHHDGLKLYEGFVRAEHQTCLAHLVRRCRALMEAAGRRAADSYAARVLAFLLHTIAVRERYERGEITLNGMRVIAGQLYGQHLEPCCSSAHARTTTGACPTTSLLRVHICSPSSRTRRRSTPRTITPNG